MLGRDFGVVSMYEECGLVEASTSSMSNVVEKLSYKHLSMLVCSMHGIYTLLCMKRSQMSFATTQSIFPKCVYLVLSCSHK